MVCQPSKQQHLHSQNIGSGFDRVCVAWKTTLVMCLEDFEGKPLKTWIKNHALTLET